MSRYAWLIGVTAAILASPIAYGQQGESETDAVKAKKDRQAKKTKKEKSALRGEYSIMASVLEMDDTQKARLIEAINANREAFMQWKQGPEAKKLMTLAKAKAEARKAKDKEKLKQIAQEMAELKKSGAKLEEESMQRIMDVLTDQQKTRWEAFRMQRQILRRFARAELTEDQKKQVESICVEAVKTPIADAKARKALYQKLLGETEQKVLTDTQREAMKKKPARREKKAPREGGKKDKAGEKPDNAKASETSSEG